MAAWGRNDTGQLGIATFSDETTPTAVGAASLQLPESTESYAYNYAGLRTARTQNQTTEHYTWDTKTGSMPMLLADGDHRYIYGPNGLAVAQVADDDTTTYLHQDQLGSTRLLTNATGTVVGTATYTAYGQPQAHTGTQSKLGYAGAYTDTLTGFQYDRARYYDPATAQFITRDPLEEVTGEPYGYANNDPLSYVDPTGQFGIPSPMDVVSAIGDALPSVATISSKISTYAGICTSLMFWNEIGAACGVASLVAGGIATVASAANAVVDDCASWGTVAANAGGTLISAAGGQLIKVGKNTIKTGQSALQTGGVISTAARASQVGAGVAAQGTGAILNTGGTMLSTYGTATPHDPLPPLLP
jgi:RHS repeat-associated protein